MADTISIKIEGLAELSKALALLPINVGKNVLRGTAYAGAKPVRDSVMRFASGAETNSPHVETGTLLRAIYMKQVPEQSGQFRQMFYVGVRRGRKQKAKGRDAYYWSWVEFGHHVVPASGTTTIRDRRTKAVAAGSYVPPHPFVRPGYESSKDNALQAMLTYLADRIESEAALLGGK